MKLMFLVHSMQLAGAERQVANLAAGLSRKGHDVSVLSFYAAGPLCEDLERAGVRLLTPDKRGRADVLGFLRRLARLVKDTKPDILHAYLESANILAALLKWRRPGMRVVWGVRCSNKEPHGYDRLERAISAIEPKLAFAADLIIVNSRAGRDTAAAEGFPAGKMLVIPNGIDTEYFRRDAASRRRFREELGVADGEYLIGRVGRFHAMKDYPTFLRAAALLRERIPSAKFLCLGHGGPAQTGEIEALVESLGLSGCAHIRSPRLDMPAVYSALDLAVSSSAYGEGFPNVLAEALACETSCVTTDVGDSAMVVGTAEAVVPARSPEALADACQRALAALPQWDGQAARERIVNQFGLARLVERTEATLAARLCAS